MSFSDLYSKGSDSHNGPTLLRRGAVAVVVLVVLAWLWPIRTVPTGSRGVITVGGAIRGLQSEGFTIVLPWQKLDVRRRRSPPWEFGSMCDSSWVRCRAGVPTTKAFHGAMERASGAIPGLN